MDFIPFWSLIPILAAIILALVLFFVSRRLHWQDTEAEPETLSSESEVQLPAGDMRTKILAFLSIHRWEALLVAVVLGLIAISGLSAPTQMMGEIPASPSLPGRPFYFIHWQRNHLFIFFNQTATAINLLTGLAALALTIFAGIRKSPRKIQSALLWGTMALAGSAQWMIADQNQLMIGTALYLLAGAGFLVWCLHNLTAINKDIDEPRPISFRWEVTLVIAIVALASFGRLFALDKVPYGIEGDEAKWTAEVVSLGLRGDPDSNGLYHRDALPISFFMQTAFHRFMGPSLFAARFEVALFSIIATLAFYFLLRQITAMPLALLASWLLSASIFDISASRLSNVESHVKLWPILTLAVFAWALRKRHWATYAIAGIALALGVLTYDTVLPMGLVMAILVIVEARRNSETFVDTLRNLMAMLTPALLTLPFLIPYFTGRLSYYEIENKGWENGLVTIKDHFIDVLYNWYVQAGEDFLYNRNGPLLNAFLIPWLTFGVAAAVATFRRRLSSWTLVWFLLVIFPVPIITHSPVGRVYYPALPAAYILAAIGLYVFTRESLRALGSNLRPLVTAISIAVLVWLPLFNLYIYFNEVHDVGDRQMRREVAELAGEAASMDNLIVLASVPKANEPLNNEFQMIELFMMGKLPLEEITTSYKNVPLEEVLLTLHDISPRMNRSVILDKSTQNDRQKRDDLSNAIRLCYPNATWHTGNYFDRVDIDAESLANPACIPSSISLTQTTPNTFAWSLSQGTANQVSLQCSTLQNKRDWVEMETLNLTGGWQTETSFATGWSGDGFIMDNYGSVPLLLDIVQTEELPLYFWVRYYKRVVDNSPAELFFNGETLIFSDINDDQINQWVWEKIGPFNAAAGTSTAAINRPYNEDPSQFIALFIDSLVYTHDPNFNPTGDQTESMQPLSFSYQTERSEGSLIVSFEPGTYRCSIAATSNTGQLIDAFGHAPVKSEIIEFTVE